VPTRPEELQERLDRINELLGTMIDTVGELSTKRCPYKNRLDECTASFGCRNQIRSKQPDVAVMCGGDDKLDYRPAWEID
jgi:hypothetical protein